MRGMRSEDIHRTGIVPFQCDGQFADIECEGEAIHEVSIDVPGLGQTVGVGAYCDPCSGEAIRRIASWPESSMQEMVAEWHRKFGVVIGETPAIRRPDLRCSLIREEAEETCAAIEVGDLVEAIDGMCDLLYVTLGTAVEFGIDLAPFFEEVHRSNMEKVGGATRDDGKILKPDGWQKPRIAEMLAELLANHR